MTYELRVAHLYGDLMNTYGDVGNILALNYYSKQIDVKLTTTVISIDQTFIADAYDLIVFGGGQDLEQEVISTDIQEKKTELIKFIESNGTIIAICGGFQLLGHYYEGASGKKIKGIGALNHYTLNQENHRFIGNITIKNQETGEIYHGFENHQGRTFLGNGEKPLGSIIEGHGNNGKDGTEGVHYKNVYGTYFHGPILTHNANLAKRILINSLKRKYPHVNLKYQELYQ